MQYKVIAYVVCDDERGLDIFPQIVIAASRKATAELEKSKDKREREIFNLSHQLINMYLDTYHMRYIIMLYMLIQEIEEIEVESIDDISSEVNDNQKREDWDSFWLRYGH